MEDKKQDDENGKDKYYVDIRVGCVAVRESVDYEISPGCHSYLSDVLAYWPGREIRDSDFMECGVEGWKIKKAEGLCNLLNKGE